MDTIFAVSSGRPPAAIAVLRVSGRAAGMVATRVVGGVPEPRYATLRALRDGAGELLDRALVLWFPGPDSATGEDLLELHLHGGRAVIDAVEAAIAALPGLRRAEPGEFTRRALLAGRIDLAQAAGLADLLEAETETQRRAAIASAEGSLSRDLRRWMDRLADIRAMIEAMIDFDDEGDVSVALDDVHVPLRMLADEFAAVAGRPIVERLREGYRIVLAGPPNSGKSSLFNALLERDAAIVAPIAGTTRDRIETSAVRSGLTFTLSDTAGLADATDDPIEREGIVRSRRAMDAADLVVWLGDDPPPDSARALWLRSRCDLAGRKAKEPGQILAVSVFDNATVSTLWDALVTRACTSMGGDEAYLLHRRERDAMLDAARRCSAALAATDPLIVAEELRLASRALGRLLGIDETEAVLDALFGRFCVGK